MLYSVRRSRSISPVVLALLLFSCDAFTGPGADVDPPTLSLQSPQPNAVVESDTVVIEGIVEDRRGIARVAYRINAGSEQAVPVDSGSTRAALRFVARGLALGSNEVEVLAYDASGNAGSVKLVLDGRDVTPPVVMIESPAEGITTRSDSLVVRGVVEDDRGVARLAYRINQGPPQEIAADSGRRVAFQFVVRDLRLGKGQLTLIAHDVAQNADTVSRAVTFRDMTPAGPFDPSTVQLREVAGGMERPIHLTAPAGDSRLFVVQQTGLIRVIENGQLLAAPFLDLTSKITSGGEQGLLGLAFHPQYAQNGYFYVNYIDLNGNTQIERYRVSADRNRADPGSAKQILLIDQPSPSHNGGTMLFGPDGMLYIGMGDGAGAGDSRKNAQNPGTLLGAILRIDVDRGDPYAVPSDNPFVGRSDARGEVWAIGLRNPWRFSIDWNDGTLYVADVGEDKWEEVNAVPAPQNGPNFGWPVMEGAHCFAKETCDQTGFTLPLVEYSHAEGCSVTGGVVYRGKRIPALRGHYVYTDFCKGLLRSFRYSNGQAVDQQVWGLPYVGSISAIAEGADGELYIVAPRGKVFVLEPR
jgi:glucose/arabinose dehydrogenase